jgi:hypothetical protein
MWQCESPHLALHFLFVGRSEINSKKGPFPLFFLAFFYWLFSGWVIVAHKVPINMLNLSTIE